MTTANAKMSMLLAFISLIFMVTALPAADNATPVGRASSQVDFDRNPLVSDKAPQSYSGYLRIYIVEPTSRYRDFTNRNYQFGFLNFAVNQSIFVEEGKALTDTVIWNVDATFAPVTQTNIMAIATVSGAEGHQSYSDPPSGYPFTAHWVDAAAKSLPGQMGIDNATGSYTHTVFLEEATSMTCSNCPVTRQVLDNLYIGGQYQFLYAAMVTENARAANYLFGDYNIGYTPTVYFDGGQSVFVGGYSNQSYYTSRIVATSTRVVAPVSIAVKLNFISGNQLSVEYAITLNNQPPATPSVPAGDTLINANAAMQFSTSAVDPETGPVFYRWHFDKDDSTDWCGPHAAGQNCVMNHSWSAPGSFDVTVEARDYWDVSLGQSPALQVIVYTAGDANSDGTVNISDAVYLIAYIFAGGPAPDPVIAGDANCDATVNISDAVYLIAYIFAGGPAPCGG